MFNCHNLNFNIKIRDDKLHKYLLHMISRKMYHNVPTNFCKLQKANRIMFIRSNEKLQ